MAKQKLKLGATLAEILQNSNNNFTEVYNMLAKIQEAMTDASDKAYTYLTIADMLEKLPNGVNSQGQSLPTSLNIGDEILILDDLAPDFWVSGNASDYSSTDYESASSNTVFKKGVNYKVGNYILRVSNDREIQLEDYQRKDDAVATYLSKNEASSTYATKGQVEEAINSVHPHNKETLDLLGTSNNQLTFNGEEVGRVQDISLNGQSVVGADRVANINIDNIEADTYEVAYSSADTTNWTTYTHDGVVYYAIKLANTDTAIEVLNRNYQVIVTQSVVVGEYLYILVSNTAPSEGTIYYIRRVYGNYITSYKTVIYEGEEPVPNNPNLLRGKLHVNDTFSGQLEDGYRYTVQIIAEKKLDGSEVVSMLFSGIAYRGELVVEDVFYASSSYLTKLYIRLRNDRENNDLVKYLTCVVIHTNIKKTDEPVFSSNDENYGIAKIIKWEKVF
jgi:hypothetical protein